MNSRVVRLTSASQSVVNSNTKDVPVAMVLSNNAIVKPRSREIDEGYGSSHRPEIYQYLVKEANYLTPR
jgi:hypothetical protein